ncbi:MAB_1171c family putative transporter [Streptomyces otsuchiensis]|uniref:MAB_1171c family putative transporter n=1 Tax=Streptomyces otsuchiensis TaxID=2681388 RepID=UPI00103038C7|nr:MAB_1171c family putative transporter [Streptomyces otsuchiensis]
MTGLTPYLAPALFLGFAGFRLALSSGARSDPVQRYICGFAAFSGLALLVNAPASLALLEPLVPTEPVIWFTRALKAYALTWLALLAVVLISARAATRGPRVRRQHQAALLFQAVAAALFVAADVRVTDEAVVIDGDTWLFLLYTALFVAYGSYCLMLLCAALTRHASGVGPGRVRTGLRILTLAVAVGVVWTSWGLTDIASVLESGRQPLGEHPVATVLSAITAALVLCGSTITLWGGPLTAPVRWLRARRRFRALEPLWRALHRALPEIALAADPARRNPELRTAEFALYRRIIEIHDGQLALRPHLDPAVPKLVAEAAARGATGGGAATIEAARIAVALDNRRLGVVPGAGTTGSHTGTGTEDGPGPGGEDGRSTVEAEVGWLVAVTEEFVSSPLVAEVREQARARTGTGTATAP